ncbi:MAG: histidine kinase, partial [Bacteroidetes bacterium]|nr:histidine kinase [Bacteroidota bacterium]
NASSYIESKEELRFLSSNGIACVKKDKISFIPSSLFQPAGNFLMTYTPNGTYIFSKNENLIYKESGDSIVKIENTKLNELLYNRKITHVEFLSDGNLWVCTFKGIICYNLETGAASLYYPELSFSSCMIDREGLYWFSSLQAGLFKVVDLNFLVWNKEYTDLKNDRIVRVCTDSSLVFFANSNGTIGSIDTRSSEFTSFNTPYKADLQSLDYDLSSGRLYFNVNGLFYLEKAKIYQEENEFPSLKSLQKIKDAYIILTSYGVYVSGDSSYKVSNHWARQVIYEAENESLWIATNEGVVVCKYEAGIWKEVKNLLPTRQILSISQDVSKQHFYALSFTGEIYVFDRDTLLESIKTPPSISQVNKIQYFDNTLFVASNNGLLKYDLEEKKWLILNTSSGLVSNSIQDFVILHNAVFLASAKGVQMIPLKEPKPNVAARIFLRDKGSSKQADLAGNYQVNLKYGQDLVLDPEVCHFASNGQFEYAYRINNGAWIFLPANVDKISIRDIPPGKYTVDLKVVDVFGADSENTIHVEGAVKLPFWKTWWFILLLASSGSLIIYLIFRYRINQLKVKQQKEMKQLRLENELRLTQQTALQAQMNPHFIFNVLNSIKGYIYENDKKNASLYLSQFSNLIRRILEQSSVPKIKLTEEIETLKLYIQLESMLLDGSFHYEIKVDEKLDTDFIWIPNLLIQPLVENAFKHGLRHKRGEKYLLVSIDSSEIENSLKIIVEDNGVGREAASQFNKRKEHQSFASSALHQRIKLLNDEREESVSFEVEDLKDESANVLGTRVILYLNI